MCKYIEMIECEIKKLVAKEEYKGTLCYETEKALHILFENLKHAKEMKSKGEQKSGNPY
jgi:hypothetical protein